MGSITFMESNIITGIILAGGNSSRMGQNKALLELNGKKAIDRIIELISPIFPRILISTNLPEIYEYLGIETVQDEFLNVGPLAGIHAGLKMSQTEKNFVIPVDMPLINRKIIEFFLNYRTDATITIAKADGYYQPLFGIYHKNCIQLIEKILTESKENKEKSLNNKVKNYKVFSLIETTNPAIIYAEKEIPEYQKGIFFNMNKPNDYEIIRQILNSTK